MKGEKGGKGEKNSAVVIEGGHGIMTDILAKAGTLVVEKVLESENPYLFEQVMQTTCYVAGQYSEKIKKGREEKERVAREEKEQVEREEQERLERKRSEETRNRNFASMFEFLTLTKEMLSSTSKQVEQKKDPKEASFFDKLITNTPSSKELQSETEIEKKIRQEKEVKAKQDAEEQKRRGDLKTLYSKRYVYNNKGANLRLWVVEKNKEIKEEDAKFPCNPKDGKPVLNWMTREQLEQIIPLLEGANLYRFDLAGLDLSKAKLNGADIREASLLGTILPSDNILGVNFDGCDTSGTFILIKKNAQDGSYQKPPSDAFLTLIEDYENASKDIAQTQRNEEGGKWERDIKKSKSNGAIGK